MRKGEEVARAAVRSRSVSVLVDMFVGVTLELNDLEAVSRRYEMAGSV